MRQFFLVQFNPELVLVSCGFDAAQGDPLGGYSVTPAGYAHMTHMLMSLAEGKVVSVLVHMQSTLVINSHFIIFIVHVTCVHLLSMLNAWVWSKCTSMIPNRYISAAKQTRMLKLKHST